MSFKLCSWAAALACAVAVLGSGPTRAQTSVVTTYHNNNDRGGRYIVPDLTLSAAAKLHRDTGFDGVVNGHVYAQPLYWVPASGGGQIIVVTESNHVVALDASSGTIDWDRALGPTVPSSELPCGNIKPLGITGTPVIDPASGTLFVVAQVNLQGAPAALAYRLSLKDGATVSGWPVDIGARLAAKGLNFLANVQGERAALTLAFGKLYVPFGGRNGDCGNYHGWMVGLQLQPPSLTEAWQTRALKGGIWSVGGAVAVEGDLLVTTGNTSGATTYGDGESVIRLPPSLQPSTATKDFFAPTDWQSLDQSDLDLGGATAVPLNVGGRNLMVALGKDGNAYLLDRINLGGIGGALTIQHVSSGQIKGGPATWTTAQDGFVAFAAQGTACASGLLGFMVIKVTAGASPSISTAWCAAISGVGSPILTTTNGSADAVVWVVGGDGDNRLHGFNAATGSVVFSGRGSGEQMSNVHEFATILAANGRLYVPGDGRIYAFTP